MTRGLPIKNGEVFGRLTVTNANCSKTSNFRFQSECVCVCSRTTLVLNTCLKRSQTSSCGCAKQKHGHAKQGNHTKAYRTWALMSQRCNNPNSSNYKYYGGRGIKVCERWQKFQNFFADMGEPPTEMSIERIDVDGSYNPQNCKWATITEQQNNKRNNYLISYNVRQQTLAQWSNELNIHRGTLLSRLRNGWTPEKALNTTVKVYKHNTRGES